MTEHHFWCAVFVFALTTRRKSQPLKELDLKQQEKTVWRRKSERLIVSIFAQIETITRMTPNPNDVASWSASGTIQAIAVLLILAGVGGVAAMARAFLRSNQEVNENYDKSLKQQREIHDQTRQDYRDGLEAMKSRFAVYDSQHAEVERRHERRDEKTIAIMESIAKSVAESSRKHE